MSVASIILFAASGGFALACIIDEARHALRCISEAAQEIPEIEE